MLSLYASLAVQVCERNGRPKSDSLRLQSRSSVEQLLSLDHCELLLASIALSACLAMLEDRQQTRLP